MKILITGGAGFVGSHLCDKYVAQQQAVVCVDNFMSGNLLNVRHLLDCRNFKLIKGDIRDKALLRRTMVDVNAVFHLAAQVHVDRSYIEPELTWDINVRGTQNILEVAKETDVERVIFASSSEVYGSAIDGPISEDHPLQAPHPYGASKIAADRMCHTYTKTYGMDISICRFFNTFGPRQRDQGYGGVISIFARKALSGHPMVIYGTGYQTRDYIYIDDAIAAYDLVLRKEGVAEPINFGSGKEVSIKELANIIGKLSNRPYRIVHGPPRIGEVQRLIADPKRAKELLGWEALTDIEDDLGQFVEWYESYGFEERLTVTNYSAERNLDVAY